MRYNERRRRHHHDYDHHGDDRGRGRMRHGDVRAALLLALQDGPGHGYELGQRLERASGGAWRPSPGSIYPTLQALADEELVESEERDGKRIFALTRKGAAALKARQERGAAPPWADAYDGPTRELAEATYALKLAVKQIAGAGTAEQCQRAKAIVVEARRQIYALLAQG
jgi:DNA-binding PadR family transcriptional regulator